MNDRPPVCDYEGSTYQTTFWENGDREYEDRAEAIALKRLLPAGGRLLLELGAGAGRNTARYAGFERVVLLDYSSTQLQQAQARLGRSRRYTYVAADIYRLPFTPAVFDAATMIRTLHHMADAPAALHQVRETLQPGANFILEYANKRNLKAVTRYLLGRQNWNPFDPAPVEFVKLNFDFHPKAIRAWLNEQGFHIEKTLAVSQFRLGVLKRLIPTNLLVGLDSLFQGLGGLLPLSPSIFVRARLPGRSSGEIPNAIFKCPACGNTPLTENRDHLDCPNCGRRWPHEDGIYNFKEPAQRIE